MHPLYRKLGRELWQARGQALAIALVVACGVATFVMARSTLDSLRRTQEVFYTEYRFADVFASLTRAPQSVADRIRTVDGVSSVETRVVSTAKMRVPGFDEPVIGHFVSVPDDGSPLLNRVYIRQGRPVAPYREDEIVISDGFADAHGLEPGDTLTAVINGRRRTLTIAGLALSPEFVYQIHAGAVFPDFERSAIVWMGREALGTALDMGGAFNDVALTVSPGVSTQRVIESVDLLLAPYGTRGAVERADQTSHNYLTEEFRQLDQMATVMPSIFLAVAAFLLHVVVGRLVQTQREIIAVLKAFGYSNREVGVHYLLFVLLIALVGIGIGLALGVWMGRGMANLYMQFYRFPYLDYQLNPDVVLIACGISLVAATTGTFFAVRSATVLPPAEAMRPQPPALYRKTVLERVGLAGALSQPVRMILRHLERRPLRAALTVAGTASACAIVMMGLFFSGAVDFMIEVQYTLGQRDDAIVVFTEPTSAASLYSIEGMHGVEYAEGFRFLDVELRHEHRTYRTNIQGIEAGADLKRLFTPDLELVRLPPEGLLITPFLQSHLGIGVGDTLTVDVQEGRRLVRRVPVAAVIEQYVGQITYMDVDALNRMLREGDAVSGAYVAIDDQALAEVYDRLQDAPRVASLVLRKSIIEDFYETTGENWLVFAFIIAGLAGVIAFGVIYNSARIALSERSRELASLRILGFTRQEISFILLGELSILVLLAIPVGFVLGWGLCAFTVFSMQTEMFQVPLVMEASTYASAAVIVLVSAFASALIVRRRLYRLNLVDVLKTRE